MINHAMYFGLKRSWGLSIKLTDMQCGRNSHHDDK